MSDQPCTFGLWYDFRNPSQWHRPFSTLYREVLDQIAWAEVVGLGSVWLTEHTSSRTATAPRRSSWPRRSASARRPCGSAPT